MLGLAQPRHSPDPNKCHMWVYVSVSDVKDGEVCHFACTSYCYAKLERANRHAYFTLGPSIITRNDECKEILN